MILCTLCCTHRCTFAYQTGTFGNDDIAHVQTLGYNVFRTIVVGSHFDVRTLGFSVYDLIDQDLVLKFECSGLRDDNHVLVIYRYFYITVGSTV